MAEEEKVVLREIDKDPKRRKKMLIIGFNEATIDDLFSHLVSSYDMLTTSFRIGDISRHIELFEPEMLVVCLGGEQYEDIAKIVSQKKKLEDVRVVVIGNPDECKDFEQISGGMVDLVLHRPIKVDLINLKIEKFYDDIRKAEMLEEKERLDNEAEAMKEEIKNMWKAVETSDHIMDDQMMERQMLEMLNAKRRRIILVIDDDTLMLKVIKEHLKADYDVATAVSGKIAYKFIEKKKPDLILLDYQMPDEDGPEVLRHLREDMKLNNLPVVFLTGVSDGNAIKRVLALKPQGYLLKPVDRVKLLDTVKKFSGG